MERKISKTIAAAFLVYVYFLINSLIYLFLRRLYLLCHLPGTSTLAGEQL